MGEPEERRDDATETPETPASDGGSGAKAPESSDAAGAESPEVIYEEPHLVEPAAEPEVVEAVEVTELDRVREQLAANQARLRTVSKAYTDLQNEMAAFRDRMEAQSKVKAERNAFDAVSAFLDPVQNLKRSITTPGEDIGALVSGLTMVHKQFMDALTKLGLEEVPGEGAVFDPNYHEALAVMPVDDPSKDGRVLVVHQGGYAVKGKVLVAAQVVIGKHEAPAAEA
ncbi:MAG: nucleotide exchange factor GrpE [Myxococcota bacterium]